MLSIRREQIASMREVRWREHEDDLVRHLRTYFASASEALGEAALRAMIREGARRAATHGLVGRADLFLFADLMIVLGPRFDDDPELPWIKEALVDPEIATPSERLDAIAGAVIRLAREEEEES